MKKNNYTILQFTVITLFVGLVLMGNSARAIGADAASSTPTDGKYTVLAPLPCIEGGGITCKTGNGSLQPDVDFETYVQYTINLLIGLSAVVAVVMIVWGGVEYMYTASFSGKKMGLEKVTHAIYGLVLILTSYIILRTIDPRLVEIPNTLVPKIVVETWLARDTKGILMSQVESDINEYKIKSLEIGKEMQTFATDRSKKRAELAEIVNELKKNDPTSPKYEELMINKARKEDEIRQIDIKYQVQKTKSELNGILISSADLSANFVPDSNWSTTDQIKSMLVDKATTASTQQRALTTLKNLGSVDNSEVINSANYTNATIDLNMINVVSVTATSRYVNAGMGIGGANTSIKITVTTLDAKEREFSSKAEAKKYLQDEINKVVEKKNTLTDPTLKEALQKKIDDAQKRIDGNKVYN